MAICIALAFPVILQMYIMLKYRKYISELEQKIHKLDQTQQEAFSAACKRYDDIIAHKDDVICFLKERLEELDNH